MVERIKAAASKRGLTLAQLEQRLGFGIRTIYKWDRNSPSVEKVLSVANFLQVPLRWLITGEKGPEDVDWELVQKYDRLSYGDQRKIDHFIEICLSPLGPKGSRALSDSSRGAGRIPVLGYIAEDIPIEGLRIPMDYIGSRETADYAMVVRDSSLSPEFEKGD